MGRYYCQTYQEYARMNARIWLTRKESSTWTMIQNDERLFSLEAIV